jgi:hypothetical protein
MTAGTRSLGACASCAPRGRAPRPPTAAPSSEWAGLRLSPCHAYADESAQQTAHRVQEAAKETQHKAQEANK